MRGLTVAAFISSLLWLAAPVAARGGMPEPLTERGQLIESIYYQIFIAGTLVFLFVMALLLYVMWRFRAGSGHGKATFEAERHSLKLELVWIIIPLFIVMWVGVISYAGLVQLDNAADAENADMELLILGQKWSWSAVYGDFTVPVETDALGNVKAGSEFYVPADKDILLNVTGLDVIHSFYIADANWGPVGMVDANPTGPHKYNLMVVNLPAGEYHVQCKEMCFNPGHAYMRAKIVSVPQAEYDAWYAETQERINAPKFVFAIELEGGAARIADTFGNPVDTIKTAPGATVRLQFANARSADVVFTRGDSGETVTVPAGGVATLDVRSDQLGAIDITSDAGDDIPLEVVQPQVIEIELGDFFIRPSQFNMDAGTLYRFDVVNIGKVPHNFFIGSYSTAGNEILGQSETIGDGGETSFLMLPATAMSFDTWCNVQGHAQSGMLATATAT